MEKFQFSPTSSVVNIEQCCKTKKCGLQLNTEVVGKSVVLHPARNEHVKRNSRKICGYKEVAAAIAVVILVISTFYMHASLRSLRDDHEQLKSIVEKLLADSSKHKGSVGLSTHADVTNKQAKRFKQRDISQEREEEFHDPIEQIEAVSLFLHEFYELNPVLKCYMFNL